MRLLKFIGRDLHGFLDFEVKFNEDLTFITGINGSGKTTVINCIVALITPALDSLASIDYSFIHIDFEHEGKTHHIAAEKSGQRIKLRSSAHEIPLEFNEYIMDRDAIPPYKQEDYEQEYYRDLYSIHAQDLTLQFIQSLPTPMFLGLDRRAARQDAPFYHRRRISLSNSKRLRNIFGRSLSASLDDAAGLAEQNHRDALIKIGHIGEELRRDILLDLLKLEPNQGFAVSLEQPPTETEISHFHNMRRNVLNMHQILRLPREDVNQRITPFFKAIDQAVKKIPSNLQRDEIFRGENSIKDEILEALFFWSSNKPILAKIEKISEVVAKYSEQKDALNTDVNHHLKLVNNFLGDSGKQVAFNELGNLYFSIKENVEERDIATLSSGEAQIFVILTHLFFNPHAQMGNVFIIDEPELSLHVQWQEIFVDSILSANPNVQYVMATHSPSIILEKRDKCIDVSN